MTQTDGASAVCASVQQLKEEGNREVKKQNPRRRSFRDGEPSKLLKEEKGENGADNFASLCFSTSPLCRFCTSSYFFMLLLLFTFLLYMSLYFFFTSPFLLFFSSFATFFLYFCFRRAMELYSQAIDIVAPGPIQIMEQSWNNTLDHEETR